MFSFLMTVQSAFFGPAKYGILPEMLEEKELSKGNGVMGLFTFMAIILGTAVGGQLITIFGGSLHSISFILIGIAVLGAVSSLFIKQTYAVPNQRSFEVNFAKDIKKYLLEIKKDKALFLTLIGVGYFWFLGAMFQMNVLMYGNNILKLSEINTSFLLVAVSIGIGLGSLLSGKLSEGKIEFGIVPAGAIGISIFCYFAWSPNYKFY